MMIMFSALGGYSLRFTGGGGKSEHHSASGGIAVVANSHHIQLQYYVGVSKNFSMPILQHAIGMTQSSYVILGLENGTVPQRPYYRSSSGGP